LVVITRECPGAIRVGKPLQIAVHGATATTEATKAAVAAGFNRATGGGDDQARNNVG